MPITKKKPQEKIIEPNIKPRSKKPKPHVQFRTEAFVAVDNIKQGVVIMKNKRYLKILEVIPTNFFNKTAIEQSKIVDAFAGYLKTSPVKMQIKIMSVPADMTKYVNRLQAFKTLKNNNTQTRRAIDELCDLIVSTTTGAKITNSRFFLIFEYEDFNLFPSFDEVKESLDFFEFRAMEEFEKCECGIVNHFIMGNMYDNKAMAEYILLHFDRTGPSYNDTEKALRQEFKKKNPKKISSIMPNDIMAPREVAFYNKKFYEINGRFAATYYVNDFRPHVMAGWLNPLIARFNDVDVDVHFVREERNTARKKIRGAITKQELTLQEISDNTSMAQDAKVKYQDAMKIQMQQTYEDEQLYYMSILITIIADTLEELEKKIKDIKDIMEAKDMPLSSLAYRQEEGFMSTLPFNDIHNSVEKLSARNITARNFASIFPFNEPALFEPDGVYIGRNIAGRLCAFNAFNTLKYENPHMMMLGSTGYGKTFAAQLYLGRKRQEGAKCFVIAPIKGYEYEKQCKNLGGQYIKFSKQGTNHKNIFDIYVPKNDITIDGNLFTGSYRAEHLGTVKTYFSILMPSLSLLQMSLLDTAIVMAYENKGITEDNDSLFNPDGTYKEVPIIEDLCIALNQMKSLRAEDAEAFMPDMRAFRTKIDELVGIMQEYIVGTNSFLNQHTNIGETNNDYTVFDVTDIENCGANVLGAIMYTAVEDIIAKCKQNIDQQKVVLIDEVWKLIGDGSKLSASFIKGMYKVFRAYNAQVITASQDIEDWKSSDSESVLNTIINNSMFQLLLCSKPKSLEILKDELALNDEQAEIARRSRKGDILFLCNGNSFQLRFDPTQSEFIAVNTDLNAKKRMEQQQEWAKERA